MANWEDSGRHLTASFTVAFSLAAVAMLSVVRAQAQETPVPSPLDEAKPAEIKIVSTEFKYAPAKIVIPAGRAVTIVLDNSRAETEHGIVFPAFGFRLDANAGEIVRKGFVFDKPGEYEFSCDLPGHFEAGMKGTLIVETSLAGL